MLRVINPPGNKVKGHLSGAQDMVRALKREIVSSQMDETASLLGGRFVRHRRKSKIKAGRGTLVLAGIVEKPVLLIANYKGKKYRAVLRRDGHIRFKNELFASPTSAAKAIVKRATNGWKFWQYKSKGEWVELAELRR